MKTINKKGVLAIGQIMILVISIIAFSLALGGGIVSAGAGDSCIGGEGECLDINEYDCAPNPPGFESGLCVGANEIKCCKGTSSLKGTPPDPAAEKEDEIEEPLPEEGTPKIITSIPNVYNFGSAEGTLETFVLDGKDYQIYNRGVPRNGFLYPGNTFYQIDKDKDGTITPEEISLGLTDDSCVSCQSYLEKTKDSYKNDIYIMLPFSTPEERNDAVRKIACHHEIKDKDGIVVPCVEKEIPNTEELEDTFEKVIEIDEAELTGDDSLLMSLEKRMAEEEYNEIISDYDKLNVALIESAVNRGKYKDNKKFVDALYDDEIITKEEYEDIKGGWFGIGQKDMDYVYDLLDKKRQKEWENLEDLLKDLETEEFLKSEGSEVSLMTNEIETPTYILKSSAGDEFPRPWLISSAFQFFSSDVGKKINLKDKYSKHKDLVDEFCEDPVFIISECDTIKGVGFWHRQKNMQYVFDLLSDKQQTEYDQEYEDFLREQKESNVEEKSTNKLQGELILPHSDALKDNALNGFLTTKFALEGKVYVLNYNSNLVEKDKYIYGDAALKTLDLDKDGWINLTELENSEKYTPIEYPKGISASDFSTESARGIFLKALMCKYPILSFTELSPARQKVSCAEFEKTETPSEEETISEGAEWTHQSAINTINSDFQLSDKYKDHKDFVKALYDPHKLIDADQLDEINGGWFGIGQKDMEFVRTILIGNMGGESEDETAGDGDKKISIPDQEPTVERISAGTPKNIDLSSKAQRRKMPKGSGVKFDLGVNPHTITIDNIEGNSVTITVKSDPQTLTLDVGETVNIKTGDVEEDDLQITLYGIGENGEADIQFNSLVSAAPAEEETADIIPLSLLEEGQTIASIIADDPETVLVLKTGEEILAKNAEKLGVTEKDVKGTKTIIEPETPAKNDGASDPEEALGEGSTCVTDGGKCLDKTEYTCSSEFVSNKCENDGVNVMCCLGEGTKITEGVQTELEKEDPGNDVNSADLERQDSDGNPITFTVANNKNIKKEIKEDTDGNDLISDLGDAAKVLLPGGAIATLANFKDKVVPKGATILDKDVKITKKPPVPTKKIVPTTGSAAGDILLNKFGLGPKAANALGHIADGWGWALAAKAVVSQANLLFPNVEANTIEALENAVFNGVFWGKSLFGLVKEDSLLNPKASKILGMNPGTFSIGVGLVVAAWTFYNNYEKEKTEVYSFTCEPWQAPAGGNRCEECNQQGLLPCTEYQCKSLGQSCELLNKGTGEEKCVWTNRNDVNPPEIRASTNVLQEDYKYNPEPLQFPNKEDRGVKIEYTLSDDKCIPAFTPLSFGIDLNEPAKCKMDIFRKSSFDEMSFFMSDSLSKYNHSYVLSLPNSDTLEEGIIVENDGEFDVYVRCMDANGNFNIGNFVFNFCVDKGPDTTPPIIMGSIVGNSAFQEVVPIRYNQSSIEMEIYTTEPAQCKWGHIDQSYESLEGTMDCPQIGSVINLQMAYACSSTLTGLKDRFENEFYFRCLDSSGNENRESYELTLLGTQPLVIENAGPNNTVISDSTETSRVVLDVLTTAGYDDGDSTCYYSDTGEEDDYIMFFYEAETSSYVHSQELWLTGNPGGLDHTYYIKCIDLGGNADYATIDFTVKTDLVSPLVIRAYHEESYLKIITDEESDCVYDTVDCSYAFEDGISMTSIGDKSHFTSWDTNKNFYVKCGDQYDNLPAPDRCSITVRPSEF